MRNETASYYKSLSKNNIESVLKSKYREGTYSSSRKSTQKIVLPVNPYAGGRIQRNGSPMNLSKGERSKSRASEMSSSKVDMSDKSSVKKNKMTETFDKRKLSTPIKTQWKLNLPEKNRSKMSPSERVNRVQKKALQIIQSTYATTDRIKDQNSVEDFHPNPNEISLYSSRVSENQESLI